MLKLTFTVCLCVVFSTVSHGDVESDMIEFAKGGFVRYSAKGHPKAKGASFTLKYPKSWVAKEGDRPNILQKFQSDGGRGFEMLTILTRSFPAPPGTKPTNAELKKLFSPDEMKGFVPSTATFLDAKSTELDGQPAGMVEWSQHMETAGATVDMHSLAFEFFDGTTRVMLNFSVLSVPPKSPEGLVQRMAEFKPLFTLMANSLVVEGRWKQ